MITVKCVASMVAYCVACKDIDEIDQLTMALSGTSTTDNTVLWIRLLLDQYYWGEVLFVVVNKIPSKNCCPVFAEVKWNIS